MLHQRPSECRVVMDVDDWEDVRLEEGGKRNLAAAKEGLTYVPGGLRTRCDVNHSAIIGVQAEVTWLLQYLHVLLNTGMCITSFIVSKNSGHEHSFARYSV